SIRRQKGSWRRLLQLNRPKGISRRAIRHLLSHEFGALGGGWRCCLRLGVSTNTHDQRSRGAGRDQEVASIESWFVRRDIRHAKRSFAEEQLREQVLKECHIFGARAIVLASQRATTPASRARVGYLCDVQPR
ncbi:hypothetical protein VQ042_22935, partial [Aurantimonas sp. A2-1-M11]|uniref:hypothetical protein n=1 Tax=Aurantimonas sp. A2-1-M11 TaxID=3113712 RepID=UPI002F95F072